MQGQLRPLGDQSAAPWPSFWFMARDVIQRVLPEPCGSVRLSVSVTVDVRWFWHMVLSTFRHSLRQRGLPTA